jgi:ribosomal protein L11 methyltransferase
MAATDPSNKDPLSTEGAWVRIAAAIPADLEEPFVLALGAWAQRGYETIEPGKLFGVGTELALPEGFMLVVLYVESEQSAEAHHAVLHARDAVVPAPVRAHAHVTVGTVEPGWSTRWKELFQVLRVTPQLTVRPTWRHHIPSPGEKIIDLDPGCAFGTGGHATTQLCLRALSGMPSGERILDLGTGSGILAIGAALLGARFVLALDNDPLAVEVARENVFFNAVDDTVRVEVGELDAAGGDYDGVVANILAVPLIRMAKPLVEAVRMGGWICLSGLLRDEAHAVREAYLQAGATAVGYEDDGDWAALVFVRGTSAPQTP